MFNGRLRMAFFLIGAVLSASTISAEPRDLNGPYSAASLNGEFSLVGAYTGDIARQLGVVHINDGEVSGFLRVNVAGSTPEVRTVVYLSFTGAVTIAEDGTGVVTLTVTYPDGSLHQATLDILISEAREVRGVKVATKIEGMQRETPALSPGSLITTTLTRRPE